MQKGNGFIKFMLVLCAVLIAAGTYFIVKSVDHLRYEMEKLRIALQDMPAGIPAVQKKVTETTVKNNIANFAFYDQNAQRGGRMITVSASDTKNMNSLITNDAFLSAISSFTQDGISERSFSDISKFEPKLAESWERLDGGLRFRIRLRKGVLWHDFTDPVTKKKWENVEMTAEDFKFYVEVVKNPKTDCAPLRTYLSDLDRVEIINKYEFDVIWKKKYFLAEEVTLQLEPLPRHLYHAYEGPFDPDKFNNDNERNRMIVGVGPYRFERWDKGNRIVLRRWNKYYGAKYGVMPPLQTIAVDIIPHPATQLQSLISKDVDEVTLTPEQWIHQTSGAAFQEKDGWLRKIKTPSLAYNYIGFNLKMPVFSDAKTRVALSHLVDKERIVKELYHGLARPVTGPFFPDSPATDKSLPVRKFSLELARKLLAEAGWKDTDGDGVLDRNGIPLKFTVIYPSANPIYPRLLPIVRQDMARAGVKMELQSLEWSVCLQRLEKKKFEACAMGWQGGITPDPFQLWHSSMANVPASSNFIGFVNPEADKLIEQIRVTFDPEERTKLYHKFHRLIYDEAPYIFMVSPYNLSALSKRYQNVRIFPLGYHNRILWTPRAQQLEVPGM
ncbi:MAG: hypothetical protein IKB25_11665 [Lentisphaeria bacterium]|nr:hypothetical protein [Lentisphaeria bacterium]